MFMVRMASIESKMFNAPATRLNSKTLTGSLKFEKAIAMKCLRGSHDQTNGFFVAYQA